MPDGREVVFSVSCGRLRVPLHGAPGSPRRSRSDSRARTCSRFRRTGTAGPDRRSWLGQRCTPARWRGCGLTGRPSPAGGASARPTGPRTVKTSPSSATAKGRTKLEYPVGTVLYENRLRQRHRISPDGSRVASWIIGAVRQPRRRQDGRIGRARHDAGRRVMGEDGLAGPRSGSSVVFSVQVLSEPSLYQVMSVRIDSRQAVGSHVRRGQSAHLRYRRGWRIRGSSAVTPSRGIMCSRGSVCGAEFVWHHWSVARFFRVTDVS